MNTLLLIKAESTGPDASAVDPEDPDDPMDGPPTASN